MKGEKIKKAIAEEIDRMNKCQMPWCNNEAVTGAPNKCCTFHEDVIQTVLYIIKSIEKGRKDAAEASKKQPHLFGPQGQAIRTKGG